MRRSNKQWVLVALLAVIVSPVAAQRKGVAGPSPQAIVNAASFAGGGVSPGEIAALFGERLGPLKGVVHATGSLPEELAGVRVAFDGIPAPLYFVSDRQINLQVPHEISGRDNTRIKVAFADSSGEISVPVITSQPGVFTENGGGTGPALILNYDGSRNENANPAPKGSRITLYATGLGSDAVGGETESIEAHLAGHPAPVRTLQEVSYAPGLFRIEILVPQEVTSHLAAVRITAQTATSQAGVTVAIDPERSVNAETLTYLNQGWRQAERQWFYNTTQGSQLIPYDWFIALEQPGDERLFLTNTFIDSLGYLPNPPDPVLNPDGLPVGFTKDPDPETGDWLGLTCAACHTGQINYRGIGLRIDGAPALSDFEGLYQSLLGSLEATLQEEDKWRRFAARLAPTEKVESSQDFRSRVEQFTGDLRGFAERSHSPTPYGFGRVDAFGILTNEVVGTALGRPENVRIPNAPVSYPFLWNTPRLEWVQWNGSVHIPLLRNIGEVLGVFAQLTLTGAPANLFKSSADVHNLFLLETQLESLRPPRWPEHVLGAIDQERAARGKAVFEGEAAECSDCHLAAPPYPLTSDNGYGRRFIPVTMVPFATLGTDTQAILDFSLRTANTGPLAEVAGSDVALTGPLSNVLVREVMKRQFAELGLSEQEQLEHIGFRDDREQTRLLSYKAGPLAGIWATAPYLHNGSVPNLYELLLPPEQRSKTFYVGNREFDPAHVGLDTSPGEHTSLLDTGMTGNSNGGHTYGADLSDDERWDLVEYLKTL